ncbi:MAG: hypothetical protein CO186_08890 [Zetaproteobacteria bacterium CG_4_9_14_3_um_filter_49_83]|nr:MAG: hypothetical protein AUJ56_04430 [Zetaproteobacteria bacterium CG1_02_49_23]PIQ31657.1 MAG: hypothetical protein COW62_09235 [Zetaproteobacteria bacterium CG17_big_fil_post_rev_8_21_14_2_50_50_13]PIV31162.1 MAG: hypothetical protein COS35_02860 [Zetaproteobacteria bacterium CG02_land_8_20_14_3_00_50_9]PIY55523.1 MAG: hypothetical protein COZ00_09140 [Zetaproteobacteria bacterium CG_4_10_14_0_8_um_filter_49_80]PJA34879.1 MAG: hypothetical protein CO186_08890 [Zetaproteobacteria bacterium
MIEFALADENLIFIVALVVMLVIAMLEGVGMLLGMGISELFEAMLPDVDVNSPEVDAGNSLSRLLGWLRFGEVPVLMLLVVFLTAFGLIGLSLQTVAVSTFGVMVPGYLMAIPTLMVAMPVVRVSGGVLARIMPKDETEAVTERSFVGRIAVVTLGCAKPGSPAEARLSDQFGQSHYIMVEPDDDESFPAGTEVLLVSQQGARFRGIRNSNQMLKP